MNTLEQELGLRAAALTYHSGDDLAITISNYSVNLYNLFKNVDESTLLKMRNEVDLSDAYGQFKERLLVNMLMLKKYCD